MRTYLSPTLAAVAFAAVALAAAAVSQNYTFDFNNNGLRTCLVSATVATSPPAVTIQLLDAAQNTSRPSSIYRRAPNGTAWTLRASNLPPGTTSWTDNNVQIGETWEYQIKRAASWNWFGTLYDATGYSQVAVRSDRALPQGRMILVVSSTIANALPTKVTRLRRELTADGWFVEQYAGRLGRRQRRGGVAPADSVALERRPGQRQAKAVVPAGPRAAAALRVDVRDRPG
jgi:hypothetical protein